MSFINPGPLEPTFRQRSFSETNSESPTFCQNFPSSQISKFCTNYFCEENRFIYQNDNLLNSHQFHSNDIKAYSAIKKNMQLKQTEIKKFIESLKQKSQESSSVFDQLSDYLEENYLVDYEKIVIENDAQEANIYVQHQLNFASQLKIRLSNIFQQLQQILDSIKSIYEPWSCKNEISLMQNQKSALQFQLKSQGDLLKLQENFSEAIWCYDNILQFHQNDINCLQSKSDCLKQMGNYEIAARFYDKALEIDSENFFCLKGKGECLKMLGQYLKAQDMFEKALKQDQKNVQTNNEIGYCLKKLNKYERAIEYFDISLSIEPENLRAIEEKGECLELLHYYDKAIELYNKGLDINPLSLKCLGGLGTCLNKLNNLKESEQAIDKLQSYQVDVFNSYFFQIEWIKGECLMKNGLYQEAINCFDNVAQLIPFNPKLSVDIGICLMKLESYEDALNLIGQVLIYFPNDCFALLNQGVKTNQCKMNNKKYAVPCLQKALEHLPKNLPFNKQRNLRQMFQQVK